ncbi:hypothetical protein JTE90_011281 [Oedothorax gibbosus]|uniref:Uncharacterized protein n=1 Tax=Oedothorax gibbosus TaxID=931172 RepID=A0AAV6TX90_9ARAC|nr:hypothetical protein JTE90_011281 [Oedothorax gibbosus]
MSKITILILSIIILENESFPVNSLSNTDLKANTATENGTLSALIVKNSVERHVKRAGHGHKSKKEQSLAWRNYYDQDTNKVQNWNYGNRGYQAQYSPQKQNWKNTGTAQQVAQPKGYSHMYYGADTISKPAANQISSGGMSQQVAQPKGTSHLYYGADTISKPAADQISSGGYKNKQKTPWEAYSSYYSPQAKSYQTGSHRNKGYGWTQNKQPSVNYGKYSPQAEQISKGPAQSYQPPANNAQKWGYKGPAYQSNVLPKKQENSHYYAANQKSKAPVPVASQGSSYHQPKSYSHLYYGADSISKPAADQVSFSGNHNKNPNSRVKPHQQWQSNNAGFGNPLYSQYTGKHTLGHSNYYNSHRKRRLDEKRAVSTTADYPSSTPSFIMEFFHEHIIGTASSTATSVSDNDLQMSDK